MNRMAGEPRHCGVSIALCPAENVKPSGQSFSLENAFALSVSPFSELTSTEPI